VVGISDQRDHSAEGEGSPCQGQYRRKEKGMPIKQQLRAGRIVLPNPDRKKYDRR